MASNPLAFPLKDLGLFSFAEVYNNALDSMKRRMSNGMYGGMRGQ